MTDDSMTDGSTCTKLKISCKLISINLYKWTNCIYWDSKLRPVEALFSWLTTWPNGLPWGVNLFWTQKSLIILLIYYIYIKKIKNKHLFTLHNPVLLLNVRSKPMIKLNEIEPNFIFLVSNFKAQISFTYFFGQKFVGLDVS